MHELALCEAIADSVARRAAGRPVRRAAVQVGHLRQVVPESLLFYWDLSVDGTALAGCALEVEHVEAVIGCRTCGARTTLDLPVLVCGACDGTDVVLEQGEEFVLVSIDVVAAP